MPRLLRRLLRSDTTQKSMQHSVRASSELPSLGFISVQNSTGASAAAAELSQYMGDTLQHLEFEGSLTTERQLLERKVLKEASKYNNVRVRGNSGRQWVGGAGSGREEAQTIYIAMQCAKGAYEPDDDDVGLAAEGLAFTLVKRINATADGTTKAVKITEVQQLDVENPDSIGLLPLIVIAVRGSVCAVDWIVNANSQTKDATEFLNVPGVGSIEAHSGFLQAAEFLEIKIREVLATKNAGGHVVFTGHSAGGAVASILFARFLAKAKVASPQMCFSLITFGAPSVTSLSITPLLNALESQQVQRGLCLAIVNEGDTVARVDKLYVRALVDIYRAACELPRLSDAAGYGPSESADNIWTLPQPCMFHIGNILLIRDACYNNDNVDLRVIHMDESTFGELLSCNTAMHSRDMYSDSVDTIFQGKINGRNGW
ncbi:hypothetical protein BDD12DRAFT_808054 [Trichophaea hybrida]|nr:hypothetical protein BDD12DRAFT_808054 [Trichophaea hybrida]